MTDDPKDITKLDVSPADVEPRPTAHSGSDWKVLGEIDTPDATGVLGHTTAGTGQSIGVHGVTDSNDGFTVGVRGDAIAGSAMGIMGTTSAPGKTGSPTTAIFGYADANSPKETIGVVGSNQNDHRDAMGVGGVAGSSTRPLTSRATGVKGVVHSTGTDSAGVYGEAASSTGVTHGIYGTAPDSDGYGVFTPDDARAEGAVHAGDGFRGNVGSSAYLETDQTVNSGERSRIDFDTTLANERSEFDPSAGTFTPEYDGTYAVDVAVGMVPSTLSGGDELYVEIVHDALPVASTGMTIASSPGKTSLTISKTLFDVRKDDTILVEFDNRDQSHDVDLYGHEARTFVTIRQVA